MRIATQTESALICKEYSSPFIVSPIPVFPAPQRTPSRWAGVKGGGDNSTGRTAFVELDVSGITIIRDLGRIGLSYLYRELRDAWSPFGDQLALCFSSPSQEL
ncbi:hypothetical protein TNCV_3258231 [Trichonephila clavipes]|nr:hypothetical protein TNCV_3258231 [Trichonephila clavipes]